MDTLVALSPYIVAVISIFGVIFTAIKARDTQLSAAYFSKMTTAYEDFWECFTLFVYCPNDETRNRLSVSVYRATLYASEDAAKGIQLLYEKAIVYTHNGNIAELDRWAGNLQDVLREEVVRFQRRRLR